jgi:hypothetical protein
MLNENVKTNPIGSGLLNFGFFLDAGPGLGVLVGVAGAGVGRTTSVS